MLITPEGHVLYLPVETAARELDAKLLLALHAVRRGFRVILGSHTILNMNLHRLPTGIYLLQSFNRPRRRLANILARLGHRIEAWDEEGLVWLNADIYARRRIDHEVLHTISRIYVWGEEQAEALRKAGVDNDLALTGNPRTDLLRTPLLSLQAEKARELQRELGNFILVNSNFGWLNYALAKEAFDRKEHLQAIARRSRHPLAYLEFRQMVFESFLELIPALARAFPERMIVLRPHPSENPKIWKEAFANLPNVLVHYDSHLTAWLLASSCMIHNNCTTAVEYAIMGRVPISFDAVRAPEWESPQPNAVSTSAPDIETVLEFVRNPPSLKGERKAALDHILASPPPESSSAEQIAIHLAKSRIRATTPRWTGRLLAFIRKIDKQLAAHNPRSSSNPEYVSRKVPDMDVASLQERINVMQELQRLPGPSSAVHKLLPHLYIIEHLQ